MYKPIQVEVAIAVSKILGFQFRINRRLQRLAFIFMRSRSIRLKCERIYESLRAFEAESSGGPAEIRLEMMVVVLDWSSWSSL